MVKRFILAQGLKNKNTEVIYAGANPKIFNSEGYQKWNGEAKVEIVSHWGGNWQKDLKFIQN